MHPRRRIFALALAPWLAILALATPAHAGGMNLAWSDCGAFGASQRNFACDTNAGDNVLYVSAVPLAPMPQLTAAVIAIDLATTQPLSPWWSLQSLGCRADAFSVSFDFTAGTFRCVDPWLGRGSGGGSFSVPFAGANSARIRAIVQIPSPYVAVDATHELYLASVHITNAHTVGAGSCAGCTDGACIVLKDVQLVQPVGVGDQDITGPLLAQYVTWQPGGSSVIGPFGTGCPAATPVRTSTWGSVKALYR